MQGVTNEPKGEAWCRSCMIRLTCRSHEDNFVGNLKGKKPTGFGGLASSREAFKFHL